MRPAFVRSLVELARSDKRIFLLVGDVGYGLVEPFAQEFPDRFVNIGIAEQNMVGVAAGLALCGKTVFVYSLANFPTLRCLEQIRNDVCYHKANVKVVTSGGGLGYGALGATHHTTEDLAIMRALPNMTVIAPGDPLESALATQALASTPGPAYLRLSKSGDPVVYQAVPVFEVGKAIRVREGSDVALIATGGILHNTVQAARRLSEDGIQCRVLSMHTLKPFDVESVLEAARDIGILVTVEEHSIIGGLWSATSEALAGLRSPAVCQAIGLDDAFCTRIGSQSYLQKAYSLSVESICGVVKSLVRVR
ncbi:MAG: transketolase [Chloroflexi bacterium]|nr:transketolase [Chloroflexota bacterium]